jgi:hypothetical protein
MNNFQNAQHAYLHIFLIDCHNTCKNIFTELIEWLNKYSFFEDFEDIIRHKIEYVKNNFFTNHKLYSLMISLLSNILTKSNKEKLVEDELHHKLIKIVKDAENTLYIHLFENCEFYSNIDRWVQNKSNLVVNVPKQIENIITNNYSYVGTIYSIPIEYEKMVLSKLRLFNLQNAEEIEQLWSPTIVTSNKTYAEALHKYTNNSDKIIKYKNTKKTPVIIYKITSPMMWSFPFKLIDFKCNYKNYKDFKFDSNPCLPSLNINQNIECVSIIEEFQNNYDLILFHNQMKKFIEV